MLALIWLLLRSGTKPSRLAYPCQRAAAAAAAASLGGPLVATAISLRYRLLERLRTRTGKIALAGLALAAGVTLLAYGPLERGPSVLLLEPARAYAPKAYLVPDARGNLPGRYGGVDDLFTLLGTRGWKLYRSDTISLYGGPDGLIGPQDIVLVKINEQWSQRGGTNTDVLRGLLRRIVEHPDGPPAEVVVVENGQGSGSFTRTQNNAEDWTQSPQQVVNDFIAEGYAVSLWLWDTIRTTSVQEYSSGNMTSGYVVSAVTDPESGVRVSYPKFQTTGGRYISMKYGLWDPGSRTYDENRLKFINVPVLKCHSIYGVTASVKHHMGVVTRELSTNSHNAIRYGGLGSYMAEVRVPDLNILDCIWVLARPGWGPAASYTDATRMDILLAGVDPVAVDIWAVKHVLVPAILANGYTSYPQQDPDNPNGNFRYYLDRSMSEMLAAGILTSNDYTAVNLSTWAGDGDRDGDLDLSDFAFFQGCFEGSGAPAQPGCERADVDDDEDVDGADFSICSPNFTGPF